MKRFTLITVASLVVAGCGAIPQGKKSNEGGRYIQMQLADFTLMQVDYPTPALCAAELQATRWVSHADLTCRANSVATDLKFGGVLTYKLLGLRLDAHFSSGEFCEEVKKAYATNDKATIECTGAK